MGAVTEWERLGRRQVKLERAREGFPLTALRELTVLLELKHPNIVEVFEVVVSPKKQVPTPPYTHHAVRLCRGSMRTCTKQARTCTVPSRRIRRHVHKPKHADQVAHSQAFVENLARVCRARLSL